jgi:hypothetical protein
MAFNGFCNGRIEYKWNCACWSLLYQSDSSFWRRYFQKLDTLQLRAKDLTTSLATYITKPTGAINTTGTLKVEKLLQKPHCKSIVDAKVYADGSASHADYRDF